MSEDAGKSRQHETHFANRSHQTGLCAYFIAFSHHREKTGLCSVYSLCHVWLLWRPRPKQPLDWTACAFHEVQLLGHLQPPGWRWPVHQFITFSHIFAVGQSSRQTGLCVVCVTLSLAVIGFKHKKCKFLHTVPDNTLSFRCLALQFCGPPTWTRNTATASSWRPVMEGIWCCQLPLRLPCLSFILAHVKYHRIIRGLSQKFLA